MEAAALTPHAFDYVRRHHPLGPSTGWFVDERGDWPALVARALAQSAHAVELSALDARELPGLVRHLSDGDPPPFGYVSVHGPSQGWTGGHEALVEALGGLAGDADALVMHPDTLEDSPAYRALGRLLAIENMDPRKAVGQTVEDLRACFERYPRAGFVLDVAHADAVDPSLELAHALLDAFGPRLRHVHLSALDADCRHVPLGVEDALRFAPVLERCRGVPWLLEAPLTGPGPWTV